MKKNILIAFSLAFSLIGFSEMKIESNEHKDECLGEIAKKKEKKDVFLPIYDALNMLINDENCFISKIDVLPEEKITTGSVIAHRPNCKIKIANISPNVKIVFTFDKFKKNNSLLKDVVALFTPTKSVEKKTILKYYRDNPQTHHNQYDYFYGNKESNMIGFRELAQKAGVCGPMKQDFVNESNQPAYVHSSSSSNK